MTDKPTFTIYSMFDFTSGINATYDPADEGLSESFAINGHVWNTDDYRFLHKECHVDFVKGFNKNLEKFAKDLMKQVEIDTGQKLIWGAASHYNTDNPHVHIVVRGIDKFGDQVWLDREYISRELKN